MGSSNSLELEWRREALNRSHRAVVRSRCPSVPCTLSLSDRRGGRSSGAKAALANQLDLVAVPAPLTNNVLERRNWWAGNAPVLASELPNRQGLCRPSLMASVPGHRPFEVWEFAVDGHARAVGRNKCVRVAAICLGVSGLRKLERGSHDLDPLATDRPARGWGRLRPVDREAKALSCPRDPLSTQLMLAWTRSGELRRLRTGGGFNLMCCRCVGES
jgi:hypothetical protein